MSRKQNKLKIPGFIKLTVTTAIQQIVFGHNEELLMIVHETKIKNNGKH